MIKILTRGSDDVSLSWIIFSYYLFWERFQMPFLQSLVYWPSGLREVFFLFEQSEAKIHWCICCLSDRNEQFFVDDQPFVIVLIGDSY